jgi:hypothetical protein
VCTGATNGWLAFSTGCWVVSQEHLPRVDPEREVEPWVVRLFQGYGRWPFHVFPGAAGVAEGSGDLTVKGNLVAQHEFMLVVLSDVQVSLFQAETRSYF